MSENVLITGAGNRIGASIARRLAADGHTIVIHYNRSSDGADKVASEIEKTGGKAATLRADLRAKNERDGLIAKAAAIFGPLSVLINNASVFEPDSVETMSETLWDAHFDLHAKAPMFLARDFAAQLPGGVKGNIVNMIDERVWRDDPGFFSYNLSKSVLWTGTRTLAQSLAPAIRVNAIGPGPVLPSRHQSAQEFEKSAASLPLETHAGPDEIAAAIVFVLASPSMTGQMLALDGGEHLDWRGRGGKTPAKP